MPPKNDEYRPDEVSPPGETLLEVLEERGISPVDLAQRTGRPRKTINEIIKGKAAITPETALQLEKALGVPASFWNIREARFREFLAERNESERCEPEVAQARPSRTRPGMNAGAKNSAG